MTMTTDNDNNDTTMQSMITSPPSGDSNPRPLGSSLLEGAELPPQIITNVSSPTGGREPAARTGGSPAAVVSADEVVVQLLESVGQGCWVNDSDVQQCPGCQLPFGAFRRRHHCRGCGKVFCNDCSSMRLKTAGYSVPQRVCTFCVARQTTQLGAANEVFELKEALAIREQLNSRLKSALKCKSELLEDFRVFLVFFLSAFGGTSTGGHSSTSSSNRHLSHSASLDDDVDADFKSDDDDDDDDEDRKPKNTDDHHVDEEKLALKSLIRRCENATDGLQLERKTYATKVAELKKTIAKQTHVMVAKDELIEELQTQITDLQLSLHSQSTHAAKHNCKRAAAIEQLSAELSMEREKNRKLVSAAAAATSSRKGASGGGGSSTNNTTPPASFFPALFGLPRSASTGCGLGNKYDNGAQRSRGAPARRGSQQHWALGLDEPFVQVHSGGRSATATATTHTTSSASGAASTALLDDTSTTMRSTGKLALLGCFDGDDDDDHESGHGGGGTRRHHHRGGAAGSPIHRHRRQYHHHHHRVSPWRRFARAVASVVFFCCPSRRRDAAGASPPLLPLPSTDTSATVPPGFTPRRESAEHGGETATGGKRTTPTTTTRK